MGWPRGRTRCQNSPKKIMNVSVVIPTYNEELAIAENVKKVIAALESSGKTWELILVNDGSKDQTLSIIQALAAKERRLCVVSYPVNRGRGYALRRGFAAAQGDYIIATESDLNWGSEIIGAFIRKLDEGDADLVIASPHMPGGRMENVPFLRWLLSYLGNKVFALAFPGRMTMSTGMTRAYRREVLESMDLEADDKELHIEILSKAFDLGYRIVEIPATLRWKLAKPGAPVRKSSFKMGSIIKHLVVSVDVQPYLFFGGLGFLFILVGALLGLYLLWLSLSGVGVAGRPALFASVLFIVVGIQILIFGFLASQNRELKRQFIRTQKLIKETTKQK